MKLLKKWLEKDSSGYVKLICEQDEDMWHVYNLVRVGDTVRAPTMRKVAQETATGSKTSQRKLLTLTIAVEAIDFDTSDCQLHLKGRNVQEHEHVKLGAYHTLDLELYRPFTIRKEQWDSIDLQRLEQCADIAQQADVAAVVMHEGVAHLCLISASMTALKAKIEMTITRKRKGLCGEHDKKLRAFFDQIAAAFARFVNLDVVKCILVASPGFLREQFLEHLMAGAEKAGNKQLLAARPKFMLVHSSSGFKHALTEVLADPCVAARLADTKAQEETKALAQFMETLALDPHRAVYGRRHVEMCAEQHAIQKLLVSDALFRSKSIEERKKYVQLVEQIREQGATVLIFSSAHVSGEQLTQMTGIAAILRFPIPDIDEEEEDVWAAEDHPAAEQKGREINGQNK